MYARFFQRHNINFDRKQTMEKKNIKLIVEKRKQIEQKKTVREKNCSKKKGWGKNAEKNGIGKEIENAASKMSAKLVVLV